MIISKTYKVIDRKRASQGVAFNKIKKGDVFDVSVDFDAYSYGHAPKVRVTKHRKDISGCTKCPLMHKCNSKSTTMGHFNRSRKLFDLKEIKT